MSNSDDAIASRIFARAPVGWRQPGFERPLAGLLFYIVALLLLAGPFWFLTVVVVPAWVQPFPSVDGSLAAVDELLVLGWSVLDFGMGAAIVRACAANEDRSQLVAHLRLLVRWQLRVAFVLALLGASVALWILPSTRYAPLRDALLLRSLCAPLMATLAVPTLCEALQRYDRQLLLEVLDKRLLTVLVPIPCVLFLRSLGWRDEATRALVGVALGQALAMAMIGTVGAALLQRMGLPLSALWRGALPSRDTRRALLRFGAGIMAGKAIFFVTGLVELWMVATFLADYPRWLGVRSLLLGRLLQPMWLLWPFCETALPVVSQASVAGLHALVRGYVGRYLQLGNLLVATLFALGVGAGAPMIRASLPASWQPAASLIPLAGLTGLLLPCSWIADAVQRAAGESARNAMFLLCEQALRLVLLVVVLPRFGLAGLFAVTALAALVKTCAVFVDVGRRRGALRLPWSRLLGPPLIAALAVGGLARLLVAGGLAFGLGSIGLLVAAALAFPVAFFVIGLVGGWEPSALAELRGAAQLVPIAARAAALLVRAAVAGARLGLATEDARITVEANAERELLQIGQAPQPNDTN